MKSHPGSLILGAAVGVVYGLVKVRSPAPPAIAILGLIGMLAGEQAISLVRSHVFKSSVQLGAVLHEAVISDDFRGTDEIKGASDVVGPGHSAAECKVPFMASNTCRVPAIVFDKLFHVATRNARFVRQRKITFGETRGGSTK